MKVIVIGVNDINIGAQLMKTSIIEMLVKIGVKPRDIHVYNNNTIKHRNIEIKDVKEYYFPWFRNYLLSFVVRLKIPVIFFKSYLFHFNDTKADIILDASGFRYGDSWKYSDQYLILLKLFFNECKKNNAKLVAMPQAFGPFQTNYGKKQLKILESFDVIFARDELSYKYLKIKKNIKIYPDFTPLLKVKKAVFNSSYCCIIPNSKMLKVFSIESYLDMLSTLIEKINDLNLKCIILNHSSFHDIKLVKLLAKRNPNVICYNNIDCIKAKSLIGGSLFTISSRYHALISSLSQNIPCLSTSWNHKYEMAYKDYGLDSYIIKTSDKDQILNEFDNFIRLLEIQRKTLKTSSTIIKNKIDLMWKEIENKIMST